jgi:hypothetical protein
MAPLKSGNNMQQYVVGLALEDVVILKGSYDVNGELFLCMAHLKDTVYAVDVKCQQRQPKMQSVLLPAP